MKVLKYFILLVFFSQNLWGCGEDNTQTNPVEPHISLSANPVQFQIVSSGDTSDLDIVSNTSWKIAGNKSWSFVNLISGKGNIKLKLYVKANDQETARSNTLSLSATGAQEISIQITQQGKEVEEQEPFKPNFVEPDATGMQTELSAIDFGLLLGKGWNLGNSLEAIQVNNAILSGNETSWGNPVVSKLLIDSVKAAGFNAVRIPVSWSHMLEDQSSFRIKYSWKKRVEEVVNYVLDNNMYAMINIHWDGGWLDYPDFAHQQAINTKLDSLWRQIAVYFRDYDSRLIFAGTNEIHVINDYGVPTTENVVVQNSFNQTFVNTVRATGGRNTYRFLLVQGYNTNIEHAKNHMIMPTDETPDRLMAEVHFYDPYDFTLMTNTGYKTGWGTGHTDVSTWGQEDWVNTAFGYMKTSFVDKGIPVILGEYGAVLRSGLSGTTLTNHIASRNYFLNYVCSKAMENGMVPFYWDNGYNGNNGFALFNRSNGKILHKDALEAIISAGNKN